MRTHPIGDPIVTANIYCAWLIDDLLRDAVAPLRAADSPDTSDTFLWFYRYGKRGEHLKLRIHAPESQRERWRANVEQSVASFLAAITAPPAAKRMSKSAIPPVDVEDAVDADHPDRSLLWTTYRRSPVVVGAPAYVRDDRHMALFARAAAASADVLLLDVLQGSPLPSYLQRRQNALLKLIIAGLEATDFPAEQWPVYLAYHHGWLTRHVVANSPLGVDAAALDRELADRVDLVRGSLDGLARVLAERYAAARDGRPPTGRLGAWSSAIGALFAHVAGYRGQPEYDLDPYTGDHTFLPLFKVLHVCANQLGFRLSHEAFVYRLLLEAARSWLAQEAAS